MATLKERFRAGDFAGVMRQALRQLEVNPYDGDALLYLAKLRINAGDFVGAQQVLSRMYDEDRDAGPGRLVQGQVLAHTGSVLQGLAVLKQLALEAGKSHEAQMAYGQVAMMASLPKDACEAFKKAVAINPNDSAAHLALAGAYASLSDAKALEHVKKAAKLNPNDLPTIHAYVEVLLTFQKYEEAKTVISEGLKLKRGDRVLIAALNRIKRDAVGKR